MGKHLLLLPGLLLSLPLTAAWTTALHCQVVEGARLPLVSRFFLPCVLDSSLSFLASCVSVTNLTRTLEAVPRNVGGLCLAGPLSVLPQDAFSDFPGLKVLCLTLRITQLLPGALRGLEQLQRLSFLGHPRDALSLAPEAFSNLSSLQHLAFWGLCLDRNLGVRLPPSLQRLAVRYSCLQNVGMLTDIFPDLVLNSSSGEGWALDTLDLSFNLKLNTSGPGALRGLQLRALRLDNTEMKAAAVTGLGLQRLDVLSAAKTGMAELPGDVIAHFGLKALHFQGNTIGRIAPKTLASCHTLESLDLKSSGLTDLPLAFLDAMPRLQTLNLAANHLQIGMLCSNGTGVESGLRVLDLSDNGLWTVPPDAFSCVPHLRTLLLKKNRLAHLDGHVFQGLSRLETLDLTENLQAAPGQGAQASLSELTTPRPLDTAMVPSSIWDFRSTASLSNLILMLPSGRPRILSLPIGLVSLELHAVSGTKPWKLVPPIFPALQKLTLKHWGLQLAVQNVSKIFPALLQLSLLGDSLEALCPQDASRFFLWQHPGLQQLTVTGIRRSPRPCCITGLPSLQELILQNLQAWAPPRPVRLEELVGELPRLEVLQLSHTGLETLSAAGFQGLRRLQVLVLDWEDGLVLDSSLQEHSPQMPQYMYFLSVTLACECANGWVEPWLQHSSRTYVYINEEWCSPKGGGRSKSRLFPFLQSHCPESLGRELFLGTSALLLLLMFLPFLQEARNWALYLRALCRAWLRGQRTEGQGFFYDVFVSHCRQDQGWVVGELVPLLEGFSPGGWGLRACLPERDFEAGKDVADNVADSMMGSRATLCVLSREALCTPRCCTELRLATSRLLAASAPPALLLVFLEPVSRHQLPGYHRLAWLLRPEDYRLWRPDKEGKDDFRAWLGIRLGQGTGGRR
ncbi:toll-like receptor 12 [Echinops telfairi]|uniref:Toll-like receptor 12 n=1 Tax=Echinops telfairi TaxID=9371 RepID=A0ABM0IQG2_ECHTE|nr:toll-like receptor 12 [Echinops telfairi]